MARLEDLVTPTELLDAIKSGSMKDELIKEYKASEQDLALMLQPLYRRGRLTKDEFNNFFKGIMIAPQDPSEQEAAEEHAEPNADSHNVPHEMLPTASLNGAPRVQRTLEAAATDEVTGPEPNPAALEPLPQEPQPFTSSDKADTDSEENKEEKEWAAPDSAGVTALLGMIYSRLKSIDERLAHIEKKLGKAD
jgi:hypothetical protein